MSTQYRRLCMRTRVGNEDPVLLDREMMFDTNEGEVRIGNGVDTFNDLTDIIRTRPPTVDPLEDLRTAVNNGTASTTYPIGTQINIDYADAVNRQTSSVPFNIVSYRKMETQDGIERDVAVIQARNCIPSTPTKWDENEPAPYQGGCNRYKWSNIRQWLNSTKPANEWFTPQHEGDVAPGYANIDGFLYGLPESIVARLKPVKICTYIDDYAGNGVDVTYDKVWLPSKEEIFSKADWYSNTGAPTGTEEGPAYEYWENLARQNGHNVPMTDQNVAYSWLKSGNSRIWYLRSAVHSLNNHIWFIHSNGEISVNQAYQPPSPSRPSYIRPCMAIF